MPPWSAVPRANLLIVIVLAVAVLGVSTSGPLIAFAAAPALAIAFWRNALATAVVLPVAGLRRRDELRTVLTSREGLISGVAGLALALHFGTWVPSVKLTSVATATALVATQPVWQGLIARAQGRRLPPLVWGGIGLAVVGAMLVTGADFTVSTRAVFGDLLAAVGAMAAAAYTAAGEQVRASVSTTTYTAVCYGVCTVVLGVVCLVGGVPMGGYSAVAWLAIVGLVLGPQLLGHSMFSYALRRVSATRVSVLILLEVPAASLISWVWLGQLPPPAAWPGLVVLLVGVGVVILGGRRGTAGMRSAPPEQLS
jgi:drug/metabolite transporter (DMT)-like permease